MISNKKVIKSILFLLIIFIVPLIFEYIGINYGAPLGVKYYYLENFKPKIFGLPIFVWILWIIFIYIGYTLTNSIFIYFLKENYNSIIKKNFNIILFSLFDGFVVLIFDIFIDPVAIKLGFWRWENYEVSYFGVPIGNFVGWYIITTTTTLFLRTLDIIFPLDTNKFWLNIVQFIYFLIIFILFIISLIFLNIDSALMGLIIASPINIILLKKIIDYK